MLEDLYKMQLYEIYYKNTNNILSAYFQTFTPHYCNALEHSHDLRHNVVWLPMTKREYYVQCTKYQFFIINQGHLTIRLGSKFNFIPNTVHCLL